jgi:putative tryptophan/tyrosine transport system substrate-binding protein
MRRRDFAAGMVLAAAIPQAQAQQHPKVYRIALNTPTTPVIEMTETSGHPTYPALLGRLRQLGYIEGQNLIVERYSGEGRAEHYPELARKVVHSNPDVIFIQTGRLARFFKDATAAIPIVVSGGDPITFGLVTSLSRPGANITGVVVDAGIEIESKRLELLKEVVPGASRIAYITPRSMWENPYGAEARDAARRAGLSLFGIPLESPIQEAEYRRAFDAVAAGDVQALIMPDIEEHTTYRRLIIKLAEQSRIPTIYSYRPFIEVGGLMSYGIDIADLSRRAANNIDLILKGAKPGDIPFWLPTKHELIINLTVAKALGLTIPPSVLVRADEVID